MRGREVLLDSFVQHGVEFIFGNPGTTENPLLDCLVEYPDITYIMALHEGVAMGAANTYAQASGKTGIVNLHAAPGLGNAMGNLFCAFKASSPVIVTSGQQDVRLRMRDPILQHDLVQMARPVTKWAVQIERPDEVGPIMRRAFKVAHDEPKGPVFVALPVDVMEGETDVAASRAGTLFRRPTADPEGIAGIAALLMASRNPAIIAGDDVAWNGANAAVLALAETAGAGVYVETLRSQATVPTGHPVYRGSVPIDNAAIRQTLGDCDFVLLIGGRFFEELWFEPGLPFPDGAKVAQIEAAPERLAHNFSLDFGLTGDVGATVRGILGELETRADETFRRAAKDRMDKLTSRKAAEKQALEDEIAGLPEGGRMASLKAMAVLRECLPSNSIIVEESSTTRGAVVRTLEFSGPGDYFSGRGGGIGQGFPGAIGAKVAHPERQVVLVSGDGSAMYSIQGLWTAAHHDLAIVFVIFANREYRILKQNIDVYRERFRAPTDRPYPMMDLANPHLDFVHIAKGMGVGASRVTTPMELEAALTAAFASGKPYLIEMEVA